MPEMKSLLNSVGVLLTQDKSTVDFGATVKNGLITENTTMGLSAYNAGLENGDKIIKVNAVSINESTDFNYLINTFKPNDDIKIVYERFGKTKETTVTLLAGNTYTLSLFEANNLKLDEKQKALRDAWLQAK